MTSLLPLVEAVDSFPYVPNDYYFTFVGHNGQPLGYMVPEVATAFKTCSALDKFVVNDGDKTVTMGGELDTFEKRSAVVAQLAEEWRQKDPVVAKGWRDELYVVFSPRTVPYFSVERAFSGVLGVVTYGVHINGIVPASKSSNGKTKMWVPRRSKTKATYPGKLDNTIAGGVAYPLGLWDNVIKECYEEGGLDKAFVEPRISSAGVILYLCQPYGPKGHAQPEVEYIYDLVFDSETEYEPSPVDGEAEEFKLMDLDEVLQRMKDGEFKPNCTLVVIDFLIRHGHITPENEENYLEITSRIHRRFPFATRN